jgi:uncharacterized protein YciI
MRDLRQVVFHRPGPKWQPGKPNFEQDGIADHIAHYRIWFEAGRLEMGGPFLDAAAGGMMISTTGLAEDAIRAHAMADPAVASGLLTVEIRPWIVGMNARG